ncbi:MAG: NUDIX domain-containing protein [Planctomycetota bacterium]|nr:NUDIX domain-containing protein [Planctomycetota bacterium]
MKPRELVQAFRFCPLCGDASFRPKPGDKSMLCAACGYEHFINSVLAAGVFVADPQGRLILICRSREPSKGKLGLPGGFSNPYESAETTARREVREEINIELGPLRYLTSYPNRYVYQGLVYPTADVFFSADAVSLAPLKALDDVQEIVFMAPRAVAPEDLAFDSIRYALRCLLDLPTTDVNRSATRPSRRATS